MDMKKILLYGLICICCVVFVIVVRKCELYMEDRISYGINNYEKTIWKSQNSPITVKVMRDYEVQVELPIGGKSYDCTLNTIGNGIFDLFRKDAEINYYKEDEWGGLDICIISFSYTISDEEMIWYNIDDSPDAEGTEVQGDFSKYKKITFFKQGTESE